MTCNIRIIAEGCIGLMVHSCQASTTLASTRSSGSSCHTFHGICSFAGPRNEGPIRSRLVENGGLTDGPLAHQLPSRQGSGPGPRAWNHQKDDEEQDTLPGPPGYLRGRGVVSSLLCSLPTCNTCWLADCQCHFQLHKSIIEYLLFTLMKIIAVKEGMGFLSSHLNIAPCTISV